MSYHFEEDEACEFGDREAVLIYNFRFWIKKNKANGANFFDGRTWTYNKMEAFEKLFKFWTKDQIRRLIDSLVNQNVLLKGNYNKNPHDRTCWYAFTDELRFLRETAATLYSTDLANLPNADGENAKSNCDNSQIQLANIKNGIGKNPTYKETDIKTDIKTFISLSPDAKKEKLKEIWLEKKLKSNSEKYFLFREKSNWKGVANLEADIAWWENGYLEKNPQAKENLVIESKEIQNIRYQIKRLIPSQLEYDMLFAGCPIEKGKDGFFIVKVSDKAVLKYTAELFDINIKIEVKNA